MDTTKGKPPRSETAKGIDHYSMKQRTTLNLKERGKEGVSKITCSVMEKVNENLQG